MAENILEQELSDLLVEMVRSFREKIKNGEATASDMKNAIQLLKDNNITYDVKKGEIPDGILDDLPFESELRVVK